MTLGVIINKRNVCACVRHIWSGGDIYIFWQVRGWIFFSFLFLVSNVMSRATIIRSMLLSRISKKREITDDGECSNDHKSYSSSKELHCTVCTLYWSDSMYCRLGVYTSVRAILSGDTKQHNKHISLCCSVFYWICICIQLVFGGQRVRQSKRCVFIFIPTPELCKMSLKRTYCVQIEL